MFGGVRAPKPPKMAQNGPRTTNAMKMKLITIVYSHETFHLTKYLGVEQSAWEGLTKKPLKKPPKNRFFRSISWNFQDYIKNDNIYVTLPCTTSLVKVLHKSDLIWGCNLPKTTQKQPKILLFAGMTNFEDI